MTKAQLEKAEVKADMTKDRLEIAQVNSWGTGHWAHEPVYKTLRFIQTKFHIGSVIIGHLWGHGSV